METFTYTVQATVWSSTGTGKPWSGEATIGVRADSDAGLRILREAVRVQAEPWLRQTHHMVPSGQLDLTTWGPKAARRR